MARKDERMYIRTTSKNKSFFQALAEKHCEGNKNALFDKLMEELKQDHPDLYAEVSE